MGLTVLGKRDNSKWGIIVKYWLKGLEETNRNLDIRIVVIQSWQGIPDQEVFPKTIVQSEGCPTVSDKTMKYLDELIIKQTNKKILTLFKI